ncbi:MAG TPA: 6-phosphogluconolactonase [Puia sp.]|jgi:glucosamine-6-phosphate deaminase|nr:6-phosphogluconolactonase [Puia sp.]
MRSFKVDQLEVRVAADRTALGQAAAQAVCAAIGEVLGWKEVVNVMFAAAPSQNEFLAAFVGMPVDWSRVNGFHLDEYIGLDVAAPQRFGNFLKQRLFSRVPFREVAYMQDCDEYARRLAAQPTDIVVLGIGENTHLAFNDPHVALFHDPATVKVVELDEACRAQQVHDGCWTSLEEVPRQAMTVTIPMLMRAEYVFGVVPGVRKALAVRHTLQEAISERYPATILRRHPRAVLFLDEESVTGK